MLPGEGPGSAARGGNNRPLSPAHTGRKGDPLKEARSVLGPEPCELLVHTQINCSVSSRASNHVGRGAGRGVGRERQVVLAG